MPSPGCGSRLCEPSSVDCAVVTGCVRASLFFSLSLSLALLCIMAGVRFFEVRCLKADCLERVK